MICTGLPSLVSHTNQFSTDEWSIFANAMNIYKNCFWSYPHSSWQVKWPTCSCTAVRVLAIVPSIRKNVLNHPQKATRCGSAYDTITLLKVGSVLIQTHWRKFYYDLATTNMLHKLNLIHHRPPSTGAHSHDKSCAHLLQGMPNPINNIAHRKVYLAKYFFPKYLLSTVHWM